MPKAKAKQKLPIKIIAITVAISVVVTLALVWLANFNYLYQKHNAAINADEASMKELSLDLPKLASKSDSYDDCYRPQWPWSKSFCGSSIDVIYAGTGDMKADEELVLNKIKFAGFRPHISFVSNDVYLESPPGRTELAYLLATSSTQDKGPDGYHDSALFVAFTKEPYDEDLATQVKNSKAKYFIVLHLQSGITSGW